MPRGPNGEGVRVLRPPTAVAITESMKLVTEVPAPPA